MTVELVNNAVEAGARREAACDIVGLSARTLERWRNGSVTKTSRFRFVGFRLFPQIGRSANQ